ncbi:hypothetical protein [Leifsonia sp. 2MCAF36]|uniref:hypothetical protein n=1 Tax=Leifsonia sp. 2MCAF36 TaxID=3232988 RepID=UPI003F962DE6
MTSDLDSTAESASERRRRRAFRLQVWVGVACFLLANFALYQWGGATKNNTWGWLLVVLPLLPVVWLVVVIVLRVRQMDEYQVKLLFPGLVVGFTVAMVTAVTLGTLDSAGVNVVNGGWAVAVVGLVGWQFTNLLVHAPMA